MWLREQTSFEKALTVRQKWEGESRESRYIYFWIVFPPTPLFLPIIISLSAVKEIDLALWRSAEAITNDKRDFMNDGEWELLSIPSRYWQIHQDNTDYAHIQFNVRSSSSRSSALVTFITEGMI